jgi:hypothetical protein
MRRDFYEEKDLEYEAEQSEILLGGSDKKEIKDYNDEARKEILRNNIWVFGRLTVDDDYIDNLEEGIDKNDPRFHIRVECLAVTKEMEVLVYTREVKDFSHRQRCYKFDDFCKIYEDLSRYSEKEVDINKLNIELDTCSMYMKMYPKKVVCPFKTHYTYIHNYDGIIGKYGVTKKYHWTKKETDWGFMWTFKDYNEKPVVVSANKNFVEEWNSYAYRNAKGNWVLKNGGKGCVRMFKSYYLSKDYVFICSNDKSKVIIENTKDWHTEYNMMVQFEDSCTSIVCLARKDSEIILMTPKKIYNISTLDTSIENANKLIDEIICHKTVIPEVDPGVIKDEYIKDVFKEEIENGSMQF